MLTSVILTTSSVKYIKVKILANEPECNKVITRLCDISLVSLILSLACLLNSPRTESDRGLVVTVCHYVFLRRFPEAAGC